MNDRVVFRGHRGMAGGPARDDRDVHRDFFAGLHGDVFDFAVFKDDAAAFVEGEAGGELVPILGNEDADAGFSALLFVGGREEDYVAVNARVGALESDEGGEVSGEHAFVVDRAAAVHVAVFNDG